MRVFGDSGGIVIADDWRERGDKHERSFDKIGYARSVRFKTIDAVFGKAVHSDGEKFNRTQNICAN